MKEIRGKVALVTGAGSGIGRAIAEALAGAGARVALADIAQGPLEAASSAVTARGLEAMAVPLDVSSAASWNSARQQIEARWGGVDILCNNAGVSSAKKPVALLSEADWNFVLGINLGGVTLGVQCLLPGMLERAREAHIVNTASILGCFALGGAADYVASKFAVVGFSEAMRMELAKSPVRVSVLCPGLVDTGLSLNTEALRARAADAERAPGAPGFLKPQPGLPVDVVGKAVLQGILSEAFYIFTHPEYAQVHALRAAEMRNAMEQAARFGPEDDLNYLAAGVFSIQRPPQEG